MKELQEYLIAFPPYPRCPLLRFPIQQVSFLHVGIRRSFDQPMDKKLVMHSGNPEHWSVVKTKRDARQRLEYSFVSFSCIPLSGEVAEVFIRQEDRKNCVIVLVEREDLAVVLWVIFRDRRQRKDVLGLFPNLERQPARNRNVALSWSRERETWPCTFQDECRWFVVEPVHTA